MMYRFEYLEALRKLGLSPKQAASFLSVDARTAIRWQQRLELIPGPVEQALRAWVRLKEAGLPWRPSERHLGLSSEEFADQIRITREHNIALDEVLRSVANRGGPAAPWAVDLKRLQASLGDEFVVYFHALPNGGFSPSSYSRTDRDADYDRDRPLIEDSYACIAEAISIAGPQWSEVREV